MFAFEKRCTGPGFLVIMKHDDDQQRMMSSSASGFKIKYSLDTSIQKRIFFDIMEMSNFLGDLTDVSAEKEPLMSFCEASAHHSYCPGSPQGMHVKSNFPMPNR